MDGQDQETPGGTRQASSPGIQPPPPNPAADKGIISLAASDVDGEGIDNVVTSHIAPTTALKMFCSHLEALANVTGDIPSTPPFRIGRGKMVPIVTGTRRENGPDNGMGFNQVLFEMDGGDENVPAVYRESGHDIRPSADTDGAQQDALARKFFSKTAPGVPIGEYVLRLHRFCPMSTAVYLATSHYINNLAIVERIVPVTPRSVHRLALAGLRVAMKALEDLSYPHHRFAKVGGVTEDELRKLEVGFCFLTDFNLLVNTDILLQEAKSLGEGKWLATASKVRAAN